MNTTTQTKRYILIAIIVIAVIGIAFKIVAEVLNTGFSAPQSPASQSYKDIPRGSIQARLLTLKIKVPELDTTVVLSDGQADVPIEGSSVEGAVMIGDPVLEKELTKADGTVRHDVILPVAVNGGGSGTFSYLVLFEDTGKGFIQKNWILLGDRVIIDDISFVEPRTGEEYRVRAKIFDREDDEPMVATPTKERIVERAVVKGNFKEEN